MKKAFVLAVFCVICVAWFSNVGEKDGSVCRGNASEHYFNGLKVGEYYDLDPAGGRIQLQSEGFGIEYRNIVLKPLD